MIPSFSSVLSQIEYFEPPSERRKLNSSTENPTQNKAIEKSAEKVFTNHPFASDLPPLKLDSCYLPTNFSHTLTDLFLKGGHQAIMQKVSGYSLESLYHYLTKCFLGAGSIHFAIAQRLPDIDTPKKIIHLNEAVNAYGDETPEEILLELVAKYWQVGRIKEAETILIRLLNQHGTPIPFSYLQDLAEYKFKAREWQSADIYYQMVMDRCGPITPLKDLEYAAFVKLALRMPKETLKIIRRIKETSFSRPSLLMIQTAMYAYLALGKYEKAKQYFKTLEILLNGNLSEKILEDGVDLYKRMNDQNSLYELCVKMVEENRIYPSKKLCRIGIVVLIEHLDFKRADKFIDNFFNMTLSPQDLDLSIVISAVNVKKELCKIDDAKNILGLALTISDENEKPRMQEELSRLEYF